MSANTFHRQVTCLFWAAVAVFGIGIVVMVRSRYPVAAIEIGAGLCMAIFARLLYLRNRRIRDAEEAEHLLRKEFPTMEEVEHV